MKTKKLALQEFFHDVSLLSIVGIRLISHYFLTSNAVLRQLVLYARCMCAKPQGEIAGGHLIRRDKLQREKYEIGPPGICSVKFCWLDGELP